MFESLFQALDVTGKGAVDVQDMMTMLDRSGFSSADPRLSGLYKHLGEVRAERGGLLDREAFADLLGSAPTLVERAIRGELVVPEFESFSRGVSQIFDAAAPNSRGKVAGYIPQLARISPDQFGVAICTLDGQRMALGDTDKSFTLQSSCKPLLYASALEAHGVERVHRHIGREPSGQSFNELTLNRHGRPHNPMINAGAIANASLFLADRSMSDRHDALADMIRRLAGNVRPGFDSAVFHSERDNADRNFALAHYMREMQAFPRGTDLFQTLDLYFAACSMTTTADAMATIAATFAGGGVCPMTGERVFAASTVKHCLSMMYSCGMYDYSGEFAFRVGMPAKSAVSGIIFAVVPKVMGIAVWSPRLDSIGNSVRGVEFLERLVEIFSFHVYDNLVETAKIDPSCNRRTVDANATFNAILAASRNDVGELRRLVAIGNDLDQADYDGRTPLHLAAVEGHVETVRFLISQGVRLEPRDRWDNAPLEEAKRQNRQAVVELLEAAIDLPPEAGPDDRFADEHQRTLLNSAA